MNLLILKIIPPVAIAIAWAFRRGNPLTTRKAHFANIAEGMHAHGQISKLADGAIATRYFLVKTGSDVDHVTPSAANTDIPLGICTDEAAAAGDLVNVALLGSTTGTLKAVAKAAITVGDFIQSNGDGKVITLKATTGTWYIVGRALTAAVSDGDLIEFDPCLPHQRVVP